MLGLGLDEELGGSKPARREATDELLGKTYGDEGQSVSPVSRRVELPANREVYRWVPESKRPLVEPSGEPVGEASLGAEPGQHRSLFQLAEIAQCADPEPPEHASELRQI
jgi:hypothetical protein